MPGPSKRRGEPRKKPDGTPDRGRPPLLTPDLHDKIINAVELLGMTENRAGLAFGVSDSTVSAWKARGRKAETEWEKFTPQEQADEKPYYDFIRALRDADPKFEMANLLNIQQAAQRGEWRASRDRLAMRYPERYGKRVMVGNDPRNPMPTPVINPGVPTVLILPGNGRQDPYLQPATPAAAPAPKGKGKAPARPGKAAPKPKASAPRASK